MSNYVIGIDQSTQGTKMLLFDQLGNIAYKCSKSHSQLINDKGWVSHDLDEIYNNILILIKKLIKESQVDVNDIVGVGISDQRETSAAWEKGTGRSLAHAVVWNDSRATDISDKIEKEGKSQVIKDKTGMKLSPYFSAAKFAWLIKHEPEVAKAAKNHKLCLGNIDAWLLYRLTKAKDYKTEPSNACRTQLLNIRDVKWDPELCHIFGIPMDALPEICSSNSTFGYTDFEGFLPKPIPINCMMGDSQAALFGQGCWKKGDIKATIGTGSSVMMNIGDKPIASGNVVTSIASKMDDKVQYVVEGNINYAAAVVSWLIDDVKLIDSPEETEELAKRAIPTDKTYLVPAFSGLGAPYWDSKATGTITGMTRTTGKAEIVKATLCSIGYQIADILKLIDKEIGTHTKVLKVDGGPTANKFLIQFISDITGSSVYVPDIEEFSAFGVALCAGKALGIYDSLKLEDVIKYAVYKPQISEDKRKELMDGWHKAVQMVCAK